MRIFIPFDLSSRVFITLSRFIRSRRPTTHVAPSIVLFPVRSVSAANVGCEIYTQHVTLSQNTEEKKTREGAKSGVGRRERMKRGRGMEDREERSKGIEIRIADAFAIIKPTAPFKLAKHEARRKRN